jgi:hypothetical protein
MISSMVAPPSARSISISFACLVPVRGVRALGAGSGLGGSVLRRLGTRRPVGARGRAVAAFRLDADGGEARVGDVQEDGVAVLVIAPDAVERGVGLGRLSVVVSAISPRFSSAPTTLAAAPPRSEPGSGRTLRSSRCAAALRITSLGVGKLGHLGSPVFGPASCGAFYDPEPRLGAAGVPAGPEISGRVRPRQRRCR